MRYIYKHCQTTTTRALGPDVILTVRRLMARDNWIVERIKPLLATKIPAVSIINFNFKTKIRVAEWWNIDNRQVQKYLQTLGIYGEFFRITNKILQLWNSDMLPGGGSSVK